MKNRICDCSCGCRLEEKDGIFFEFGETICYPCDKGNRAEFPIIKEVCKKCGKPAFGLCNDGCGFLCLRHDVIHRHETGHITENPVRGDMIKIGRCYCGLDFYPKDGYDTERHLGSSEHLFAIQKNDKLKDMTEEAFIVWSD